jgi:hypothetical protein
MLRWTISWWLLFEFWGDMPTWRVAGERLRGHPIWLMAGGQCCCRRQRRADRPAGTIADSCWRAPLQPAGSVVGPPNTHWWIAITRAYLGCTRGGLKDRQGQAGQGLTFPGIDILSILSKRQKSHARLTNNAYGPGRARVYRYQTPIVVHMLTVCARPSLPPPKAWQAGNRTST